MQSTTRKAVVSGLTSRGGAGGARAASGALPGAGARVGAHAPAYAGAGAGAVGGVRPQGVSAAAAATATDVSRITSKYASLEQPATAASQVVGLRQKYAPAAQAHTGSALAATATAAPCAKGYSGVNCATYHPIPATGASRASNARAAGAPIGCWSFSYCYGCSCSCVRFGKEYVWRCFSECLRQWCKRINEAVAARCCDC